MNKNKSSAGSIAILVIGIILYLLAFILQQRINAATAAAAAAAAQAAAQGTPGAAGAGQSSLQGYVGVIAQFQVIISTILVVTNRKRGFITVVILNVISAISAIMGLLHGQLTALPGIFVSLISIGTMAIIYFYLNRTESMHAELSESYNQLIEQNRVIQEKDETLTQLAYYDKMTGMPNSAYFHEALTSKIESEAPFALIYMDADNFKQINDNFGHDTGDELIRIYANRILKYCGTQHICAKVGGDEFAMILDGKRTEADVLNIIEDLRKLFADPCKVGQNTFAITMSYGIAGFPNDGIGPDDLMKEADRALYNAKINGKNRPMIASPQSLS